MKKYIISAVSAVIVLSVCCMTVFASNCHSSATKAKKTTSVYCICRHCSDNCTFTDADKDGICDNCNKKCSFVDADNDGICDNCNKKCRFVDADNDGICDNCNKKCKFVDADNDGICDNCGQKKAAAPAKKKCGSSHKHGHSSGRC